MQDSLQNRNDITVSVRCRYSETNITDRIVIEGNNITVGDKSVLFDNVFLNDACEGEIYDKTTKQLLNYFIEGYNVCIFAYGRTASGKTHTLSNIMRYLIEELSENINDDWSNILFSAVEIYTERIRDLVNNQPNIKIEKINSLFTKVDSKENLKFLNENAFNGRVVAHTAYNDKSSRSHLIIRILNNLRQNKLSIIDLAGSETYAPMSPPSLINNLMKEELKKSPNNIKISVTRPSSPIQNTWIRPTTPSPEFTKQLYLEKQEISSARKPHDKQLLLECKSINQSLLALSNMIRDLAKNAKNISYRSSVLTTILGKEMMNAKISIICTINQHDKEVSTTIDTIDFGSNAKNIHRSVSAMQIIDANKDEKIARLTKEKETVDRRLENTLKELKSIQQKEAELSRTIDEIRKKKLSLDLEAEKYYNVFQGLVGELKNKCELSITMNELSL